MSKGDYAFFYHSNCKVPGIVGIMEIVQEHSPDGSFNRPLVATLSSILMSCRIRTRPCQSILRRKGDPERQQVGCGPCRVPAQILEYHLAKRPQGTFGAWETTRRSTNPETKPTQRFICEAGAVEIHHEAGERKGRRSRVGRRIVQRGRERG